MTPRERGRQLPLVFLLVGIGGVLQSPPEAFPQSNEWHDLSDLKQAVVQLQEQIEREERLIGDLKDRQESLIAQRAAWQQARREPRATAESLPPPPVRAQERRGPGTTRAQQLAATEVAKAFVEEKRARQRRSEEHTSELQSQR